MAILRLNPPFNKPLAGLEKPIAAPNEEPRTKNQKRIMLPLKDGITTTEFWLTAAAGIAQVVLGSLGMINATWASAGITITTALYSLLRAGMKTRHLNLTAAAAPPK